MKVTADLELGKFTRSHWIFLCSFGLSSFLQALVITIEDPTYQNLFGRDGNSGDFDVNGTAAVMGMGSVDEKTGSVPLIKVAFEESEDFSATFFGLLLLYYHLLSFVLTPLIGGFVEDIGLKRVYMFGIYVAGLSPFLSAILDVVRDQPSYMLYSFLIRGVQAFGAVGMQVSLYMMITIIFPVQVASIFAVNQAMSILGVLMGGPLALFIATMGGFAYRSRTFWTLGGIYVCFALVLEAILPDLPAREPVPTTWMQLIRRYIHFITIPPIILYAFSLLVTGIGFTFLQALITIHIKNYDVGVFGEALIPLLPALLQLLSPVWGFMLDRLKFAAAIALTGTSIATISLLVVGPAPFFPIHENLWSTCTGLVIFGLGQGALIVSSYVLIMQESQEHGLPQDSVTITIVSTTFVGAMSAGGALGSLTAPIVLSRHGFRDATLLPLLPYSLLIPLFALNIYLNPQPPTTINAIDGDAQIMDETTPLSKRD